MKDLQWAGINVWIDDVVPCLKDAKTGEVKETIAFEVKDRRLLRQYRIRNGWHINWDCVPNGFRVYALALKDSHEIQGLVALKDDPKSQAVYIHWACAAPHNNKHDFGEQKYSGVGGHLFAIAAEKSIHWGYGGYLYGFAASETLLHHYINVFHAQYIGILHIYQFAISETDARKILEVYNYEWSNY